MALEQKPMISVIVPVYNAENYIRQCYASLRNQTYDNLELIFVDDASKDNSVVLLEECASDDNRVRIIKHSENKGVSAARNTGLSVCRGELIGFCDSDDICAPGMFENMAEALVNNNADVACCALNRVTEQGCVVSTLWESKSELSMNPEEAIRNWLIGRYIGNSVYTKLARRALWEDLRFPEGEIFEEAQVIPQLLANAQSIVHTGTVEYLYCIHGNSITAKPADKRLLVVYEREKFVRKYVMARFPQLEKEITCFEVRNNVPLMMSAELSRKSISKELYGAISSQFNSIFIAGLTNRYVSLKNKIHLLEIRAGIFSFRKGFRG